MNVQKWCEKKFWQKFCSPQTGLIDKQKAVLTTGLTKFRRNDIKKLLNAQWWKKKNFIKKNFFKKSSWIRGKQMWQICRFFFDKKKSLFLRSILEEHEKKKTKPLSKQSFVLKFFLWSRRMQFCQTNRNFFGKKGTDEFLLNFRKWWRKKFGQTFFHQKLV